MKNRRKTKEELKDVPDLLILIMLPLLIIRFVEVLGILSLYKYYKSLDKRRTIFIALSIIFFSICFLLIMFLAIHFFKNSVFYILLMIISFFIVFLLGVLKVIPERRKFLTFKVINKEQIDELTWQDFEDYVARLFGDLGYYNGIIVYKVSIINKLILKSPEDKLERRFVMK
jgi:hypothetical protein